MVGAYCTTNGQSFLLDDGELCPDVLFVRSHYDKLLQKVDSSDVSFSPGIPALASLCKFSSFKIILIDPALSFQFYMFHRFLSGDSLSPDSFGSTAAPEVVIRQVGDSNMEVWDIKEGRVMNYEGISRTLLRCFDPKKSF